MYKRQAPSQGVDGTSGINVDMDGSPAARWDIYDALELRASFNTTPGGFPSLIDVDAIRNGRRAEFRIQQANQSTFTEWIVAGSTNGTRIALRANGPTWRFFNQVTGYYYEYGYGA